MQGQEDGGSPHRQAHEQWCLTKARAGSQGCTQRKRFLHVENCCPGRFLQTPVLGEPSRLSKSWLEKALPEVIVEAIHRQEVNVRQKDVWRLRVGQGHVAQEVDGVELPLLVDDVVGDIAAGTQHLRGLGIAQELLSLCI